MGTLFDNVVDKSKVWRGAARLLYAPTGTSFPGCLESVIQPKTPADPHAVAYALTSPWVDFGGTTEDGITIAREFTGMDGVPVDQLMYNLFEGDPTNWTMRAGANLLHTDVATLAIAWELPATVAIGADTGPDYKVAQSKLLFSAPTELTDRLVAAVQQHPDEDNLRVFVFRSAKLSPAAREMVLRKTAGTSLPIEFELEPDTTVDADQDPFGALYEET